MAANQGLYNGFLVAGLVWSFLIDDMNWSENIAIFFLGCIDFLFGLYCGGGNLWSIDRTKEYFLYSGIASYYCYCFDFDELKHSEGYLI